MIGPWGPKLWYYKFSFMKMEEYMESEFSGILQVKLIVKNMILGSSCTDFIYMKVKMIFKHSERCFAK